MIKTVVGMPLGRYFFFVGSVLLALLFVADRYLPQPAAAPSRSDVDRGIRIHSQHRWPEKIVLDTSLPTIVPPVAIAAQMAPSPPPQARPPREAFALAVREAPHAAPASSSFARKPVQKRRTKSARKTRPVTPEAPGEFRIALPVAW